MQLHNCFHSFLRLPKTCHQVIFLEVQPAVREIFLISNTKTVIQSNPQARNSKLLQKICVATFAQFQFVNRNLADGVFLFTIQTQHKSHKCTMVRFDWTSYFSSLPSACGREKVLKTEIGVRFFFVVIHLSSNCS